MMRGESTLFRQTLLAQARKLELSRNPEAPTVPEGMRTDTMLHTQLAQVLGVPDSSNRLGWDEGSDIRISRPVDVTIDRRTGRLEEALFLKQLVFARQ